MASATYKKGQAIYKIGEHMREMGLVIKGSVLLKSQNAEIVLEKGHLLGVAGCDSLVHPCDYIALEDTVISTFPYRSSKDLATIFKEGDYGSVFILAALKQTDVILKEYLKIGQEAKELYNLVVSVYRDYKFICSKYSAPEHDLSKMEYLTALDDTSAIAEWKEDYYRRFVKFGLAELKDLFTCQELCIGTIEQAGEFMRQMIARMDEGLEYIEKSKGVLLSDKKGDLFQLVFDLETRVAYVIKDRSEVKERMEKMIAFLEKYDVCDKGLVLERIQEYRKFDFAECDGEVTPGIWDEDDEKNQQEDDRTCLQQILSFAGYNAEEITNFEGKLRQYMELPDRSSNEGDARSLRKWLSEEYYKCYKQCVRQSLEQGALGPIICMFVNFGFMDVAFAGGEENANAIYDLMEHLFACNVENVHTFYEWLKSIYEGKNDPSINELDLDFNKYLKDGVRTGQISVDQEKEYRSNPWYKVEYEIDNMFHSGGKITSGRITTFCPILSDEDIVVEPKKLLVTAAKIREAIEQVRSIDYSIFYREVMFNDDEHGISKEFINQEILPDIILLPNAGSKAMMWQPTGDARNNTPARFLVPIFTLNDVSDMIIENCGRYRWEICRKIQGSRWNDVTTPSLTSEYSDYLQYFRKNFELSQEAKDKLHAAIKRARNNNREVFVKDYESWIKFEAKGSFRLNKVARGIMCSYCMFGVQIRSELKDNPMYQEAIKRHENQNAKKVKRLTALYNKYTANGGEITKELSDNMEFYSL